MFSSRFNNLTAPQTRVPNQQRRQVDDVENFGVGAEFPEGLQINSLNCFQRH